MYRSETGTQKRGRGKIWEKRISRIFNEEKRLSEERGW